MESVQVNPFNREKLTADTLNEWQGLLNVAAELFGVPAGLITRVDGKEIEILLSSESEGNPYAAGYTTHYPDSGWYCERALKSNNLLLIPNALLDPEWKDNAAAVGQHIISYMGIPIARPDGGLFGTMCFLDNRQNAHNSIHIKLLEQIKRLVELSLRNILDKDEIDHRDRILDGLSKIYPICSYCKKVREGTTGTWVEVEKYVMDISGNLPSHGVCPQCFEREMKKLK
ncbi:MAG: GAF domain-containing protein [Syntrophales bacterium LBB04]|nr:GAF domain-containing protein [Syntrophales bacterium LBB04]